MRKYSLFGLIFILFLGLLYNSVAQETRNMGLASLQDEEVLLSALEMGGFDLGEFNIHKALYISDTFLPMEELEERLGILMEALNMDEGAKRIQVEHIEEESLFEDVSEIEGGTSLIQKIEKEDYRQIMAFLPNEDGYLTVLKLLSTKIWDKMETYIMVDIVNNKGYKEIVEISKGLEEILKTYGEEIQTTVTLTGICSGKMTEAEQKERQNRIFEFLEAKKVEALEDEFYTSITAYSPLISSSINYGGKEVNLQLATRYNEYENKTYLWIANPLITTTY